MASIPVRRDIAPALGIDYSTHAVHMALVGRDAVLETTIVDLDRKPLHRQLEDLREALSAIRPCVGLMALIEAPYYGHDNPDTALKLSRLVGILEAVATVEGFWTRTMRATEWRPLAGIGLLSGKGVERKLRAGLKQEACRLVKLEFGLDSKDDNLAEAILIGRVAVGLQSREAAIA